MPSVSACFTKGAGIATPDGPRPVETLQAGDLVTTVDGGPQAIVWTSRRHVTFGDEPDIGKPVQIKMGALAPGLPGRDHVVSPQHRFAVTDRRDDRNREVFVAAKALTVLPYSGAS